MQTILVATHNPAKLKELSANLKKILDRKIKVISLKDVNIDSEPEETGKDFAENSLLKAKYYAEKSGLPTIADDGGIEIDVLRRTRVNSKDGWAMTRRCGNH
jgi:XTP/dITP diphosphohydrolase